MLIVNANTTAKFSCSEDRLLNGSFITEYENCTTHINGRSYNHKIIHKPNEHVFKTWLSARVRR